MSECAAEATVSLVITTVDPEEPLAIGQDCVDEGYWWSALSQPTWGMRYEFAPPSQFLPGQSLLSAVPDAAAVAAVVVARGADLESVVALKAALEAVLAQWRYTVSIVATTGTGDVVLGSWVAQPTMVTWGPPLDETDLVSAAGTVSIPVNPVGAP